MLVLQLLSYLPANPSPQPHQLLTSCGTPQTETPSRQHSDLFWFKVVESSSKHRGRGGWRVERQQATHRGIRMRVGVGVGGGCERLTLFLSSCLVSGPLSSSPLRTCDPGDTSASAQADGSKANAWSLICFISLLDNRFGLSRL